MAFTMVTVEDVATMPAGEPIPYAVVVAYPVIGFANAGETASANSAIADADGNFSLQLAATDDSGTAPLNPDRQEAQCEYHFFIFVSASGESIHDADVLVPSAQTTMTIADLMATLPSQQ